MKVVVIVEPGSIPPPPEQLPMLIDGMRQWRDKWRSKMDVFGFWAGRPGGFGVLNVADEAELSRLMMEFPFGAFSQTQVHPYIDGDQGLAMLAETTNAMMAAMQGTPR